MFPPQSPTSIGGQLESEIRQVKSELWRKADDYKVSSLNSKVDDLVRAIRDISSVCDGILSRLQTCEENIQENKNLGAERAAAFDKILAPPQQEAPND